MRSHSMITVAESEDALVATITTQKILADDLIEELGASLLDVCVQARRSHKKMLLVDFKNVALMSSIMLGKLILLNKAAKTDDVILRMCNVAPNVFEVFKITHLDKVMNFGGYDEGPGLSGSFVPVPRPPKNDVARAKPTNESP